MKATQIVNPSEMKVVELEKPTIGASKVLVRIKYVGFCDSNLNTLLERNPMVKLPVISGHEVGTVIEEIGPNVSAGFEKGMNVTLNPHTNCGRCASCRNGRVSACERSETLGVQCNGVMHKYAVLPWTKIIPAGSISPRNCMLIEPVSVGFHAVPHARIIDNEYMIAIGCGMTGIGAIVRTALGGATVIAVDLDDEKLGLAKRVGASCMTNSKTENVHKQMQQVTEGFSADIMIEAVGSPVTYVMAVDEIGFTGRVVCVGYTKSGIVFQTKYFVQKELDTRGSRNALLADFRAVINYVKKGNYPVEELISKIARPEGALEAMQGWTADPGKVFRILVGL